jgi:hypothetical protein
MGEKGQAAGLLDLIDDPPVPAPQVQAVVIADRFKRDRGSFRESGKELQDRSGFVIDPGLLNG